MADRPHRRLQCPEAFEELPRFLLFIQSPEDSGEGSERCQVGGIEGDRLLEVSLCCQQVSPMSFDEPEDSRRHAGRTGRRQPQLPGTQEFLPRIFQFPHLVEGTAVLEGEDWLLGREARSFGDRRGRALDVIHRETDPEDLQQHFPQPHRPAGEPRAQPFEEFGRFRRLS